ncbi:MAG: lytic transglycosylase domain-containing protein [Alphaproteobacteria bacterium]|nr:lytic transglycosylase domain-containing protein [Alphaproteobacteria bacterium]
MTTTSHRSKISTIRLVTLAVAGVLALGGNATAATKDEVARMVAEEAAKNGRVPVSLALGLAKAESNFNDAALSPAGARGVMQIMPKTAMGEFGVPADALWDPKLNIRLGISYLERLYNLYGRNWDLALSHYNGGSLRVRNGKRVAHDNTHGFIDDVNRWARGYASVGTAVALSKETTPTLVVADVSSSSSRKPRSTNGTPHDNIAMNLDKPVRPTPISRILSPSERFYRSVDELGARFRVSLRRNEDIPVSRNERYEGGSARTSRYSYN